MPKRIQCSEHETPGGAVYVGAPTIWADRYKIGDWSNTLGRPVATVEDAHRLYREVIWGAPHMTEYLQEHLRGKDLACSCPLDAACHADVLLDMANAPLDTDNAQ
jgi:hypothetical protein